MNNFQTLKDIQYDDETTIITLKLYLHVHCNLFKVRS